MRKIKGIIALILVCTLIAGCGESGKPDGVSDEMYEAAVYAIKVVDLYLDGESTIDDTYNKLNSMKLTNYETLLGNDDYVNYSVYVLTDSLRTDAFCIEAGTMDISVLKEDRNKLAEKVNYKD